MATESYVQIDEGTGKKLHHVQRSVGADTVEEVVSVQGEPFLNSYVVSSSFGGADLNAANSQLLALSAGSRTILVRKIDVYQRALATTAGNIRFALWRLSTAPSGGTALDINPLDSGDPASDASASEIPTTPGTESVLLGRFIATGAAAHPIPAGSRLMGWEQHPNQKAIVIPAGSANGLTLRLDSALTGAEVTINMWFDETDYT